MKTKIKEIIKWSKRNYLIVILFFVTILILSLKLKFNIQNNNINNLPTTTSDIEDIENKINNNTLLSPTINNKNLFGGKSKEEIFEMEPEEGYDFITSLSKEEVEKLNMMADYDFSDFLPYEDQSFIVENFNYENKKLIVKPLIEDKDQIREEVNNWLFYENGNNPKNIEIIWSE